MGSIDQRPASGSCAVCRSALGLLSLRAKDIWYCSTACMEGRPDARPRESAVPEAWLYTRPRRYAAARTPKELRSRKRQS